MAFDPTIHNKQQEIAAGVRSALGQQVAAAEAAIPALGLAQGQALADVKRTAAQSLAQSRALAGGGRGFGLARGTGLETTSKAGALRGAFEEQLTSARQDAAQAKTQALVEEGKLLDIDRASKVAVAAAQQDAEAIINKYKGSIYTTRDDRENMVRDMVARINATTDPAVAAVYQSYIDKLQGDDYNIPGTIG